MLQIRGARPDDLDALTTIFVACFNEPPWNDGWTFMAARERLDAILGGRHFRAAIAFVDENPVGLLLGQRNAGSIRSISTCRKCAFAPAGNVEA